MNAQQLTAITPMLLLAVTAIALMLQASVKRHATIAWIISMLGLLMAFISVEVAIANQQQVTPLLRVDHWGLFFVRLLLAATMVTLWLSRGDLLQRQSREEYYLLLILAVLGAVVLVQSSHFASLILGMELMGIALYGLIAFPEKGRISLEAAIKYLVLSASASAMLLFGFALLYAGTGDLSYEGMAGKAALFWLESPVLISAGLVLVIAGLGFKLSVAPFHMWTPDVYQGAPTQITGFLATVSKGAVFVVLSRMLLYGNLANFPGLVNLLSLVAAASMLIGNLLALRQDNIKRLLGYSSIAHFGYLLVVLIAAAAIGPGVKPAVTFYLAAYIVTTLAAFAVAAVVGGTDNSGYGFENFKGLFWRRPLQAATMTAAMLSLAGIPLTAGFIGKFYIITSGIDASLWALLAVLVAGSAIAIYYYLRLIFVMCTPSGLPVESPSLAPGLQILMALLLLLVLALGTWPQPFIAFISKI